MVIQNELLTTGKIFYVDDATGASDNTGVGPDVPMATILQAMGLCTANKGDIIVVMPDHEEDLTAAGSCVCSIAGVSIVGLGQGLHRPKLTFTTAAGATVSVTAQTSFKNIHFASAFTNGITIGINIAAGADGSVIEDCLFTETLVTQEFLTCINIASTCSDVRISRNMFHGILAGGDVSFLIAAGTHDRLVVEDNRILGDWSGAAMDLTAGIGLGIFIERNIIYQEDTGAGLGIACNDGSLGFMSNNHVMNQNDGVEGCTGNLMGYCENYGTNAVNVQGLLKPAADA